MLRSYHPLVGDRRAVVNKTRQRKTPMQDRDFSRGFLPTPDPLVRLSEPFGEWEEVAHDLSKLALSTALRPTLERLPAFPVTELHTQRACERAMSMLSFMANLYVFAPDQPIATQLPKPLAVAWYRLATRLGRPPMLTYASQTLYNWRRLDPHGPIAVGNLAMIQNFLGGMDEEWFVTLHVNIEAAAGRGLSALLPAQEAVLQQDTRGLAGYLSELTASLQTMHALLRRMPERCHPDTYYHRVRPYMFGWKNNPDLPHGMRYDGVAAYKDQAQQFRGETGAQSSVLYAFDAALGIQHELDAMRAYLLEIRDYMPVQDRACIAMLERGPAIRDYVRQHRFSAPSLREAYNEAVRTLAQFRQLHLEYATRYILQPARAEKTAAVGTGGTPFTVSLQKHCDQTLAHLV